MTRQVLSEITILGILISFQGTRSVDDSSSATITSSTLIILLIHSYYSSPKLCKPQWKVIETSFRSDLHPKL
ncbi:hypothetical protein F5X99DRAFT_385930 [Biscogniauxia marginata]|nr:hypothetical protein F5X99DRAFT_385930 [Biscogniauxia marginata]